jgi:DNA topoisomerase-3
MMKLYLMEKGSLGRALATVLPGERKKEENFIRCGGDIVAWASGHLLELCEPEDYDSAYKKWSRETLLYVPEKWKLREKERTKSLFASLRKLIKGLTDSDVVVHGGDGDREGQLLIDEILEYCAWKGKTLRLRINDVNPDAIRKALTNMKNNSEYQGEYKAGQARLYADWLVGLAMSRYVTVSLREAGCKADILSVGRQKNHGAFCDYSDRENSARRHVVPCGTKDIRDDLRPLRASIPAELRLRGDNGGVCGG